MEMKNGIFIDLGHGGKDCGALGKKYNEANLVLEIGRELNNLLEKTNIKYQFSRLTDTFLTLEKRCELANKMKADLFLSIHINSSKRLEAQGTESFVYSLKNNKLAIDFSTAILNDITKLLNTENRGVKENSKFTVLKNTKMSALILEVEFISNIKQEQVIKDNVKAIAKVIYQNILNLYGVKEQDEYLYKVCIGAFKNKDNAIKLKNEAMIKGFNDTYII